MVFELTDGEIHKAIREYLDKRNIIVGQDFEFTVKTSRKGERTSRAIISTIESNKPKQLELPLETTQEEILEVQEESLSTFSTEVEETVEQSVEASEEDYVKPTPFKKLFG